MKKIKIVPLSINNMSDEDLTKLIESPNDFLEPLKDFYIEPSVLNDNTKLRMDKILENQGFTPDEVKKRIEILAMVKVTEIIIDI